MWCSPAKTRRKEKGRREQSKADQGGVEPPQKAVKANEGFAKSYATSNGQLVLGYSVAALYTPLRPLRPVRYCYYFCRSLPPASDYHCYTAPSTAATASATIPSATTVAATLATAPTIIIAAFAAIAAFLQSSSSGSSNLAAVAVVGAWCRNTA